MGQTILTICSLDLFWDLVLIVHCSGYEPKEGLLNCVTYLLRGWLGSPVVG
jgi:hypothetical protein